MQLRFPNWLSRLLRHCEPKAKQSIIAASVFLIILFAPPLVLRLLPFPELQEFMAQEYSCRIYDRRGQLVQVTAIGGGGRREFTSIKKIPKAILVLRVG